MASPLLAASTGYDPMRRIVSGLRMAATPGTINEADDGTLYGRGDPLDVAIAEEARQTELARGRQAMDRSALTFVDPRIERDNPTIAAQLRERGTSAAAALPVIDEGPLAKLLSGAQMTARTTPMVRGAQRVENIADANAEATNYSSPVQAGYRDAQRWDRTLDAKNDANTFMNPVVRQGRQEALKEGIPSTGLKALAEFIASQGQNPYSRIQLGDLISMFKLDMPSPANSAPIPAPAAGAGAAGGSGLGGMIVNGAISSANLNAIAQREGVSPDDLRASLERRGVTITP